MTLDLNKIKFDPSPNITGGARNAPKYIVIHAMVGTFAGSHAWFKNALANVSAHYLVSQKGEYLQMVRADQIAWHCYGLNRESIGIELEDKGLCMKADWITPELWKATVELVAALVKKHNIQIDHIIPHSEPFVQKLGGGKFAHHDPGPYFNMNKLRVEVAALLKASP